MARDSQYRAAGTAMLRMPVLPHAQAELTWVDLDPDDADQSGAVRALVCALAAGPAFREAVEVSSGSLARTLDKLDRGEPVDGPALRRAAYAVTKYFLRAATRPTPFGLFAGVSLAGFDDHAKVRRGAAHRKAVRPDMAWLMATVRQLERRRAVLGHLSLVSNDLCVVRGDRLILPYLPAAEEASVTREMSVRNTAAVRCALAHASTPIRYADLVRRVAGDFPAAEPAAIHDLLAQLVANEALLTDLRPPLEEGDPLAYVQRRLDGLSVAAGDELAGAARALSGYAATTPGKGRSRWRVATEAMRGRDASDKLIQVDLINDVEVRLPHVVATELERAADTLWRLTPSGSGYAHLRAYHTEFLERYGTERIVPLRELLDPERGLGAPAGYQMPPGDRRSERRADDDHTAAGYLAGLVQDALRHRSDEIVLDEPDLARLAGDPGATPRTSLELYAQLHAASAQAIEDGEFRLVLTAASLQAGATFGRFAGALGDTAVAELADLARAATGRPGAIAAQLAFQVARTRTANVAQVPRLAERTVAIGMYADRSDPAVHGMDDLAIGADHDWFFVWSRSAGVELAPFAPHMLDSRFTAPNAVRLLREISTVAEGAWRPWTWGALETLPYLPRVRHGRTVLSPARWVPPATLTDADLPWPRWLPEFDAWRDRWGVPDLVEASLSDHRIQLNLTAPLHLRLLRRELRRRPNTVLRESNPGAGFGWLDGWANEIVVPLLAREPAPAPARQVRPHPVRTGERAHPPGGQWLYAKLYASEQRHDELIGEQLPRLITALPTSVDRWFFLRYRDPDPHLRLRVHGDPDQLRSAALPLLYDWVSQLRTAGLLRQTVLDTYVPELERYGGTEAMAAAERAFCADSIAVIELLQLRRRTRDDGRDEDPIEVLAAANCVDLLCGLGDEDWAEWLVHRLPKGEHHAAFQRHRAAALRLIPAPVGAPPAAPELAAIWRRRREAIEGYGELLRGVSARGAGCSRDTVLDSMLHMHCNRLIGIDREAERRTYAIARGAVRARLDEARFRR